MLNMKDSFTVQGLGRFDERPRPDSWSEQAQTYRQTLHKVEPPPAFDR